MNDDELLSNLVDLAKCLDYDVRFDRGTFRDGSCRVRDRRVIVLNRQSPATKKIDVLCLALVDQSLEGVFLLPVVREAIEKHRVDTKSAIS